MRPAEARWPSATRVAEYVEPVRPIEEVAHEAE